MLGLVLLNVGATRAIRPEVNAETPLLLLDRRLLGRVDHLVLVLLRHRRVEAQL